MPLKFGTSGVRGLVTDMTDLACYRYVLAFVEMLKERSEAKVVYLAGDHRASTPRIFISIAAAIKDGGMEVVYGGFIPTPAIAHEAMSKGAASVMVTGSHIPEDRNGIKFYMPWGEILKEDEQEISKIYAGLRVDDFASSFDDSETLLNAPALPELAPEARSSFVDRYVSIFDGPVLKGLKLVVYQHSTVLREIFPEVLEALGAEVVSVGWSDKFIPVDTEAVDAPERLAEWVKEHGADALISADGDGDRPLLVDDEGKVIRGDVLGILVSQYLKAEAVALPISCNTALEKSAVISKIERTKIGSPHVIQGMMNLKDAGAQSVVGFEANGGFLTGSEVALPGANGGLSALPTRDAILPILAALLAAKKHGGLSALLAGLPKCVAFSGLLRGVEAEKSKAFLAELQPKGAAGFEEIFPDLGPCVSVSDMDGLRATFESEEIVHFRPSGNAPEFRCYAEAQTESRVEELIDLAQSFLKSRLL